MNDVRFDLGETNCPAGFEASKNTNYMSLATNSILKNFNLLESFACVDLIDYFKTKPIPLIYCKKKSSQAYTLEIVV